MATYRYLTADLLTNAVLAELPLSDVDIQLALNDAGSFTGKLPLSDPVVRAIDPIGSTQPGRTAIYVDRDGVLLWGGVLWTRRYDGATGHLELGGKEFLSYFDARRITADAVFTAADQLTIARSLVNTAQAVSGGNIGVQVGAETSGVTRDRTYYAYELKSVGEALRQLAAVDNGFDLAIDVAYSGGVPSKFLRLGYPRRGQIAARSGWVWEFPGNVQGYSWPEDATSQAITSWATGGGSGPGSLLASATSTAQLDAGYPLLEAVHSYGDVIDQTTLQSYATADAKALATPVTIPVLDVRGDLDPMVGSYITGDELRLRIADDRFPGTATSVGLDTTYRIVRIGVKPPGAGGEEHVTLTLGATV